MGIKNGRILSAGCASGADVLELRKHGYDAYGFDLYAPSKEAAKWCCCASASAIPFPDGYFVAVVMLEVIEHVPVSLRQSAGKEVMRVLGNSGIVVLATPNRLFPADEHGTLFRFHSPFSDETVSTRELESLFNAAAECLTWKKYFAFERMPIARVIKPLMPILDWPALHRSPLNPHLFLAFRKEGGTKAFSGMSIEKPESIAGFQ
jgi:SAM-dependent methyltransferase